MKKQKKRYNLIKVILTIFITIFLVFFIINCKDLLKLPSNTFVVENGSLSLEESTEGYLIRDEEVLRGEEYKNGMIQIKLEGEKVSKGERVFRYYSNGEEELTTKIESLDQQINEVLANSENPLIVNDISNLDKQIEKNIIQLYKENDIEKIKELKNKIELLMNKKSQIAGEQSPAGSYIKQLIDERNSLKNTLNQNAININSNMSGIISYRVDGLENILLDDNFDYLTTELLNGFNINSGSIIPQSKEEGKIVNNFVCYLACITNSENAMEAKEGNKVTLRFSNSKEINSEIVKILEEDNNRIIVFKFTEGIEELIEFRKISFDIIWWKYSGWKVSNNAIIEENDINYVERKRAGFTEKILVKVLRQNDTFSIVSNYTDEELEKMGYSAEEIKNMKKIKVYDEILLH